MTVGAGINFVLLFDNFALIIGLTLGLMALKTLVLLILGVIFKLKGADRWLFALGLAQAGEFGFVLLSFTVANAVIPAAIADQLLLVVALSMLLTPALFILFDRVIAPRYAREQSREEDVINDDNHIIIAGHGRMGGIISRMLETAGFAITQIDFSSKQLDMLQKFGQRTYFGDATRPDLLHAAGIANAKLLIIAIDGKEQITELVRYTVHNYPDLHVMARAVDREHVYELYAAGCRDIIRETYDSSIRMGRSAFEALGISRDKAERISAAYDVMDRKAMITLAEHFDPDIPAMENEVYVARALEVSQQARKELGDEIAQILKQGDG